MLIISKTLLLHLEKNYYLLKTESKKWNVQKNSVSRLERKSLKLYDNLRKPYIIDEFHQLKVKFSSGFPQKELMNFLLYEMHAIHRLPSLLYDYPHHVLEELNLS